MALSFPYMLLTQGIYSGLITTISTVTMGTCGTIKSIYTHKNPDVNNYIKKLDIERRLTLIESVLKKINPKLSHETIDLNVEIKNELTASLRKSKDIELQIIEDYQKTKDPIELCLLFVHEIIHEIHQNLKDIYKKVSNHDRKWFSSWRTLDVSKQLDRLETNSNILEKRFNDLIEISKFLSLNQTNTH